MSNKQRDLILEKADQLTYVIYVVTRRFPKEELFGIISQLRRAALSVVLNIVEGYARQQRQEHRRFLEIAYGSAKEVQYLLNFSFRIGYLNKNDFEKLSLGYEEVLKMLWVKIGSLKRSQ